MREHRKQLRKNSTPQEEKLWWYLRGKRLIVEIDGEIHNTKVNQEYDEIRSQFLREFEYKVLRIPNSDVDDNIDMVLKKIKESL